MKTTTRMLTTGLTAIEVVSSSASSPARARRPRLTQSLLYLAAGALMAFSITLVRCDHREMNTYVHAESGSVVQVISGAPTPGQEVR